jgi:hypothetical protein
MNGLLNESFSGGSSVDLITRIFASTLVGYKAQSGTPTYSNTVVGYEAGLSSTRMVGNVIMGVRAGALNGPNWENVIIGNLAGQNSAAASSNVVIGNRAAANNFAGSANVLLGFSNATATANQSVSIGAYSRASGNSVVAMGYNNVSDGGGSITIGADIYNSNVDTIVIGRSIVNTGTHCAILKTNHAGTFCNNKNNLINIQDRLVGSNVNNNIYSFQLNTDSFVIQTASQTFDVLGLLQGTSIHHVVGSCADSNSMYQGVGTVLPETVRALSNVIIDGQLLVMGGICYGGLFEPQHVFEGDVTFCNSVYIHNCNLDYYLDKITQVGAFFDDNTVCADSNAVLAGVGIAFDDTLHAKSNMMVDGQLHVRGGICFGGLHAVAEPVMRIVHTSFGPAYSASRLFNHVVPAQIQAFDVDGGFSMNSNESTTLSVSLYNQSLASLTFSSLASSKLSGTMRLVIARASDTVAKACITAWDSTGVSQTTASTASNVNWLSTQTFSVNLDNGQPDATFFRVAVAS